MDGKKRVLITRTSEVGKRCWVWANENSPEGIRIVEQCEDADYIFSVFHNKIFSPEQLAGKRGKFNFHGGILPYYRGSCTINWALINEEKETGVSLHTLEEGIDTGSIIDIKKIRLEEDDTSETVYKKLEALVFEMFTQWFSRLLNGSYQTTRQDLEVGHLYKRKDIEKAKDLTRFVRAFEYEGKESAYYYTKSGKKVTLKFSD